MEHSEKRNQKPVKNTQPPPNPPSPTKTMFEEMEESGSKIPLMVKTLEENGWMSYQHHDNWIKKIWLHNPDVSNMGFSLNDAYRRVFENLNIEDDPKDSFYEINKITDADYPNYLHYLHDTKQTQEMCSFLTWVGEGKQMLETGNTITKLIRIRPPYLVKFVNPDKEYPVSYTIKQNGERINEPSILMGYDLTENQIVELFEKELL